MAETEECLCAFCKDQLEFDFDGFLLDEVRARNAVIFAGAGVSTESRTAAPHSLYVELANQLRVEDTQIPFPDLAQAVANEPDGRFRLLKLVQERFDYIAKFRELRFSATRFYNELATMPYLNTYITTNWDRNFEEYCDAKPFVYDADMRFWDIPRRRVLKVHGTIDDYSSIVATRSDYEECEKHLHRSLVGAKLKEILSSRTCLFIGYSLRDEDIKEIFSFVRDALGKFPKTHYFVSPNDPREPLPEQVIHIKTDGTFFLETLKIHMCNTTGYGADEVYDLVNEELSGLVNDHIRLFDRHDMTDNPQVVITGAYQDGLIHGYSTIVDGRTSGRYSDLHDIQSLAWNYDMKISSYRKLRRYEDVAYFSGYQNALIGLVCAGTPNEKLRFPPRFYYEKIGELDEDEYEDVFEELPEIHEGAFARCKKILSSRSLEPGMVIQHMPWG